MSVDDEIRELLAGVDGPRAPRPEFDEQLRSELFGAAAPDGTAARPTGIDARRGSRRRRRVVAVAIAAAAAIVLVVALVARPDGRPVSVVGDESTSTTATPPPPSMAGLCRAFRETAFGRWTRAEVIGASNAATVTTPAEALDAVTGLLAALDRFRAGVEAAGHDAPAVRQDISRIRSELVTERDRLAPIVSGEVVPPTSLQQGSIHATLRRVDDRLRSLDTSLVQEGVPSCL